MLINVKMPIFNIYQQDEYIKQEKSFLCEKIMLKSVEKKQFHNLGARLNIRPLAYDSYACAFRE